MHVGKQHGVVLALGHRVSKRIRTGFSTLFPQQNSGGQVVRGGFRKQGLEGKEWGAGSLCLTAPQMSYGGGSGKGLARFHHGKPGQP